MSALDKTFECLIMEGIRPNSTDDFRDNIEEISWREILSFLVDHKISEDKKSAECFSPVQMKPFEEWELSRYQEIARKKDRRKLVKEFDITFPPVADFNDLNIQVFHPDSDTVINVIEDNSPLNALGLLPTDRIHTVNGVKVKNWAEINRELANGASNGNIVSVLRNSGMYRKDENIQAITFIVLDLDEADSLDKFRSSPLSSYEYIRYSTAGHGVDQDDNGNYKKKYRIVMPLEAPIPVEEWKPIYQALAKLTAADENCGNLSRVFYSPTHSPNSEYEKEVEYSAGEIISQKDIYNISFKSGIEIDSVKAKPVFEMKQPSFNASGEKVSRFYTRKAPSYSFEDMLERHLNSVERLSQSDSRNAFAWEVTFQEIKSFGEKTDLRHMIYFMYAISGDNRYSSRGMDSIDSNTSDELFRMISGAFDKVEGHLLQDKYPDLDDDVEMYIQEAEAFSRIPGKLVEMLNNANKVLYPELNVKKVASSLNYNYEDILERNKEIATRLSNGDCNRDEFIKRVVVGEMRACGNAILNIQQVTQFIYRYMKEAQDLEMPSGDFAKRIGVFFDKAADAYAPQLKDKIKNVEMVTTRFCEMAHECMKSNNWKPFIPPRNAESSASLKR